MTRFLENLQKELFSAVHTAALEAKRLPVPPPPPLPSAPLPALPVFSQTVHHHHHPYFSQILFNNSFINHYPAAPPPPPPPPAMMRFAGLPSDRPFPFHLSTPKKRRTKVNDRSSLCLRPSDDDLLLLLLLQVTDTRLSPRITSKVIHHDEMLDDEKSSSNHSYDSDHHPSVAAGSNPIGAVPLSSSSSSVPTSSGAMTEYNAFQISIRPFYQTCANVSQRERRTIFDWEWVIRTWALITNECFFFVFIRDGLNFAPSAQSQTNVLLHTLSKFIGLKSLFSWRSLQ